ncbi:MAG: hypothetical protein Q9174_005132, partial [Haloplaca sp. 1 TL-2023]
TIGDRKDAVRVVATVIREAAVGDTSIWIAFAVCAQSSRAVVFDTFAARFAIYLVAVVSLRTDADAIAHLYTGAGFLADANSVTDDFMTDTAWVDGLTLKRKLFVSKRHR